MLVGLGPSIPTLCESRFIGSCMMSFDDKNDRNLVLTKWIRSHKGVQIHYPNEQYRRTGYIFLLIEENRSHTSEIGQDLTDKISQHLVYNEVFTVAIDAATLKEKGQVEEDANARQINTHNVEGIDMLKKQKHGGILAQSMIRSMNE